MPVCPHCHLIITRLRIKLKQPDEYILNEDGKRGTSSLLSKPRQCMCSYYTTKSQCIGLVCLSKRIKPPADSTL